MLAEETAEAAPPPKNKFYQDKETQKLVRSLRRKVEATEEALAALDTTIAQLEQAMVQPDVLNDHVRLMELTQELEQHKADQEEQMAAWEELSLELEEMDEATS